MRASPVLGPFFLCFPLLSFERKWQEAKEKKIKKKTKPENRIWKDLSENSTAFDVQRYVYSLISAWWQLSLATETVLFVRKPASLYLWKMPIVWKQTIYSVKIPFFNTTEEEQSTAEFPPLQRAWIFVSPYSQKKIILIQTEDFLASA